MFWLPGRRTVLLHRFSISTWIAHYSILTLYSILLAETLHDQPTDWISYINRPWPFLVLFWATAPFALPRTIHTTQSRHHLSNASVELKILLYIPLVILRLYLDPLGTASPQINPTFNSSSPFPTYRSTSISTTFFFPGQQERQIHCWYYSGMGYCMGGLHNSESRQHSY